MSVKVIFPPEPDKFYENLKSRINLFFHQNGLKKQGNTSIVMKFLILNFLFLFIYSTIFFVSTASYSLISFIILGPLSIILAINISHDAIHGAAHSNKFINLLLIHQMDLIGANSYAWRQRHKFGHHNFPNTLHKDPDLVQTDIVKILPNATHKAFHRFQHLYVPTLYSIYTFNWIYIRDFKDYFSAKSIVKNIPTIEYLKLFIFKIVYIFLFIIAPILYSSLSIGQVLLGNFLMHIAASYFLTLALVASHVSENAVFPLPDSNGIMPYSWSHHQVVTTTDFATNNRFITWILGGFNHHIAHHLFPSISHAHYPQITPIIKEEIEKSGLKYKSENSVWNAYMSHFNLLRKNGNP